MAAGVEITISCRRSSNHDSIEENDLNKLNKRHHLTKQLNEVAILEVLEKRF